MMISFQQCQQHSQSVSFSPSTDHQEKQCIPLRHGDGAPLVTLHATVMGICVLRTSWPILLYDPSEKAGVIFATDKSPKSNNHGAAPLPWSITSVESYDPHWPVKIVSKPTAGSKRLKTFKRTRPSDDQLASGEHVKKART